MSVERCTTKGTGKGIKNIPPTSAWQNWKLWDEEIETNTTAQAAAVAAKKKDSEQTETHLHNWRNHFDSVYPILPDRPASRCDCERVTLRSREQPTIRNERNGLPFAPEARPLGSMPPTRHTHTIRGRHLGLRKADVEGKKH